MTVLIPSPDVSAHLNGTLPGGTNWEGTTSSRAANVLKRDSARLKAVPSRLGRSVSFSNPANAMDHKQITERFD